MGRCANCVPATPFFPTIFDTRVPPANVVTLDAAVVQVTNVQMPQDGVLGIILDCAAANADGTDWAVWIIAEAIITRTAGVLILQVPTGPLAPSTQAGATSATWRIQVTTFGDLVSFSVQGAVGVQVQWSFHAAGNYNVNAGQ